MLPSLVHKTTTARVEDKIVETINRLRGQYLTANEIHRLVSGRIKAEELRRATDALGRITGRVDVEDLLDVVFGEFCIGK